MFLSLVSTTIDSAIEGLVAMCGLHPYRTHSDGGSNLVIIPNQLLVCIHAKKKRRLEPFDSI